MGIILAVGRLSNVFNDNIQPVFYKKYGLSFGYYFGFVLWWFSVVAAFAVQYMDKRAQ